MGNATILRAIKGRPPIAKTSLRAFAAAILPQALGESTTGVIKSRVRIPILFSSILQSAASSPQSQVVISLSSSGNGIPFKTFSRSAGPIFAAQPLVRDISVSRGI